jgi:hypothetical protein
MGDIGQIPFRLSVDMTTLLYLMACLLSPAPLSNLAESKVIADIEQVQIEEKLYTLR